MKLPVMIFVVFCTTVLMAFEDLGPLKTAQKKYPQIFKTGSVNIITINKIPCYVFSGNAEQAFSGDFAEPDSELYEEATLSAKSNFYEFLSEKDKNVSISMTGCSVLYQYNDKKLYTVILYVPKKNVIVKLDKKNTEFKKKNNTPTHLKKPEPKPSPAKVTPPSAEAQVSIKQNTAPQSSLERRIAKFRKRIKNNPSDTISLIALADLYKKSENFSEATKFYCLAIKQFEKDIFFDEAEKIRVIYNVALLFERINKNNMALKYYHYMLRHKCSREQKKSAVAAISRLRLKTLD